MSEEKVADDSMKQGEKAMGRFSLFGGSSKYEDAIEHFTRAANHFKIGKKWHSAGDAYVKIAECHLKLKNTYDAASAYQEAAKSFKRVDPTAASTFFSESVRLFLELGKFTQAAKLERSLAEIFEAEGSLEESIEHFQRAADHYTAEDSTSSANQCLNKVALFSAQLQQYEKAVELFETIATGCLESPLLKFNAKGYFLQAGICHLAHGDIVAARNAVSRYTDLDYSFSGSRECKFLSHLVEAVEAGNVDAFTDHVYNYDSVSKLDSWKTTMLLRIKNAIRGVAGEGEGADGGGGGGGNVDDMT